MYHRYMDPHAQYFNHHIPSNPYPCQHFPSNQPPVFMHSPCPNQAERSGCCNYPHPPNYYGYQVPYSYVPPPPPVSYPPHPYVYPGYSIPPPHYSLEQPRYDYDKSVHHCCGCQNHKCAQKEEMSDSSNPAQSVFWVPNGYVKDKENPNSWVPLNIKNLEETKQENQDKNHSQYPVIWLPGYDKPMEVTKNVEEPPKFKIVPLKLLENEENDKKSSSKEDETKEESKVKHVPKIIPVKQLEDRSERKLEEKSEKPMGECKVKDSEKKEKTTAKSSKLPPVCLRVDPLPRKKTANGSSRSPSPPGRQQQEKQIPKAKDIPVTASKDAKEVTVDVLKSESKSDVGKEEKNQAEENVNISKNAEPGKKCEEEQKFVDKQDETKEVKKERRQFSESDAAVVIQSAYRGFEVRRWQPLEKLRKIAKVHEQAASIGVQIEDYVKEKDAKKRVLISETIMNLLLQLDTIQGLHPAVREARKSVARELTCLQEKLDAICNVEADDENSKDAEVKNPGDVCSSHGGEFSGLEETAASTEGENASSVSEQGHEQVCEQPEEVAAEDTKFDNGESAKTSASEQESTIVNPSLVDLPVTEEFVGEVTPALVEKPVTDIPPDATSSVSQESIVSSHDGTVNVASPSCDTVPELVKEIDLSPDDENATIAISATGEEQGLADVQVLDEKAGKEVENAEQQELSADAAVDEEQAENVNEKVAEPVTEEMDYSVIVSEDVQKDVVDSVKEEAKGAYDDQLKLVEENGKLKEMLERLLESGKEQMNVISSLNGRVKDLEKKLAKKRRMKVKKNKPRASEKMVSMCASMKNVSYAYMYLLRSNVCCICCVLIPCMLASGLLVFYNKMI